MALFIANLAFDRSAELLDHARLGVLGASASAALLGLATRAMALPASQRGRSQARRESPA